ncbi:MAG TPA: hypothetical protein VJ327_01560 [Patescibacteria group bacterium]|nr:hypothetical protein [Patescibacteria group bacterium]
MKAFGFVAFNLLGKKKLDTVKTWSLSEAKRKIQQRGFYLASTCSIVTNTLPFIRKMYSLFQNDHVPFCHSFYVVGDSPVSLTYPDTSDTSGCFLFL